MSGTSRVRGAAHSILRGIDEDGARGQILGGRLVRAALAQRRHDLGRCHQPLSLATQASPGNRSSVPLAVRGSHQSHVALNLTKGHQVHISSPRALSLVPLSSLLLSPLPLSPLPLSLSPVPSTSLPPSPPLSLSKRRGFGSAIVTHPIHLYRERTFYL